MYTDETSEEEVWPGFDQVPFDVEDVEVADGRPRRDVHQPAYLRDYDCDV